MFNVDGKEFIFLVLIALVVLGPEKLPDAFRRAGRAYSEFRRISESFQSEFRKVIDEPTAEFRATTDVIRESFDLRTTRTTDPDGSVTEIDDGEFTAEEIQRIAEVDLPTFAGGASTGDRDGDDGGDGDEGRNQDVDADARGGDEDEAAASGTGEADGADLDRQIEDDDAGTAETVEHDDGHEPSDVGVNTATTARHDAGTGPSALSTDPEPMDPVSEPMDHYVGRSTRVGRDDPTLDDDAVDEGVTR